VRREKMVTRKVVVMIDDLDGREFAPEEGGTVHFALDGAHHEIDLHHDNRAALCASLAEFMERARPSKTSPTGSDDKPPKWGGGKSSQVIRSWAREAGHDVSARGRIPAHIIEAFEARGR
jgi:hypothetical protein